MFLIHNRQAITLFVKFQMFAKNRDITENITDNYPYSNNINTEKYTKYLGYTLAPALNLKSIFPLVIPRISYKVVKMVI